MTREQVKIGQVKPLQVKPLQVRIAPCGDCALSVFFGDTVDLRTNALVVALDERVANEGLEGVVETVPSFRALLIHYDPDRTSSRELSDAIAALVDGLEPKSSAGRLWRIPACYDPEIAPDLEEVAAETGLSPDDVVAIHSGETYHVYMIGFLPGYPYMGDLPEALALPRKTDPRLSVPIGSVAIAERMTAVYPLSSPGGWRLIGRTPIPIYDPRRRDPFLLSPGDKVCFTPIGLKEHHAFEALVERGAFEISPELAEAL